MIAKMKCSNCGAEISNMNMSWGRKYWLFMIPVMLLGFYPLLKMTLFKGDVTKELIVSDVKKRQNGEQTDVTGLITNNGRNKWSSVTIEAEFFDASGTFITETSDYLRTDIQPGAKEHFKISYRTSSPELSAPDTKMVVKVAGGHSFGF